MKYFKYRVRLKKSIYEFARSPNYLGFSLFPDSYLGSSIYAIFMASIHPYEFLMRRFILPQSINKKFKIAKDKGYWISRENNDNVSSAVEHCRNIVFSKKFEDIDTIQAKSFLLQNWLEPGSDEHKSVWNLAVDPLIISPIVEYLGYVPILGSALVWLSPNNNFESGRSQEFHMDGESRKQIKVFVFLDDVDEDSGPLTIIPAQKSRVIYKKLKKEGLISRRNNKVSDEAMYKHASLNDTVILIGKKGTTAFVDTDSCYHFGSRPGLKRRMVLQLQYLGLSGSHQATFNRRIDKNVVRMLKSDPDKQLKKYILGFTHLTHPKIQNKSRYTRSLF
jgi:hypothetical protein